MNARVQNLSDNYDKISSMPDSILIHILTFLKASEAVQTCLLSKRWIDLWAYLPSLKFDSEEFENGMIFKRFVNAFLLFRKTSQLDTFELRLDNWNEDADTKCVTSWVVYAVRCKPRVLFIHAPSYCYKGFPHSVFCCTPLEELILFLDSGDNHIVARSISLPFLRKLSLSWVKIDIHKLLLGCPLLEEFELMCCSLTEIKISSPSLKYLTIVECLNNSLIISCPNLINLRLHLQMCLVEITLRNLFSLKNAFLFYPYDGLERTEILNGLSHATKIKLFGRALKTILAKELPNCSTFKNLRHIVLDECFKSKKLDVMAYFLQCSPNLDKFYFADVQEENNAEDHY